MGDQEPNLVEQWAVTRGPGGHWMMGQTHGGQDLLLVETSASSPSDEDCGRHKIKHGTETKINKVCVLISEENCSLKLESKIIPFS